jgi:hypothetical protein
VKRSCRDEPMWVVIHVCIKAILGVSLYSYLYLKLVKMLPFLLSFMFHLQQNQRSRGEVNQAMYTHVSKCKNNKAIKREKKLTTTVSHVFVVWEW